MTAMKETPPKLQIMRLLKEHPMLPKELKYSILIPNMYSHVSALRTLGLIEKIAGEYRLTDIGISYLEAGDFSGIKSQRFYIDDVTSTLLEHGPMSARELYEKTNDSRPFHSFHVWLKEHAVARYGYVSIDKSCDPCLFSLSAKGKSHGRNPDEFRRLKHQKNLDTGSKLKHK